MTKIVTPEDKPAVETVVTIKNFRSNGDIEIFYRYIHDNGLRREAGMMMEYALKKVAKFRKGKKSKTLQ